MEDFRLVTMDIRGHGLSEKPRDAYGDSQLWADDIQAIIRTLTLDRPILVGWSYGGLVICDFVRAFGEERVGGINLVAAISKVGTERALAVLTPEFLALVPGVLSDDATESAGALEAMLRMVCHDELPPADLYRMLGFNVVVPPHVRQALFSRTQQNDDVLSRLRVPALIAHGEGDRFVRIDAARHHAGTIPDARLSVAVVHLTGRRSCRSGSPRVVARFAAVASTCTADSGHAARGVHAWFGTHGTYGA